MQPQKPRLAPLDESEWSDEQRELLDRGRVGKEVLNIFRTLARHPKLLKRWQVFGNTFSTNPLSRLVNGRSSS